MALKRNETYPGRFSNPTDDHPQGAFKNRSAPGAQDGSYLEQQWANDWDGFFGRLLTLAEISPNGNVDTASSSQYYDALKSLFLQRTNPFGDIKTDGTVQTALENIGLGTGLTGIIGQSRNATISIIAPSASSTFKADELIVQTALGGTQYKLTNVNVTGSLSAVGAGGVDVAGTVPTTGYMAKYVIYNPQSGAEALLYQNATSAKVPEVYSGTAMPAGYTASALVSIWPVNGLQFAVGNQKGRKVSIPVSTIIATTSGTTSGTSIVGTFTNNLIPFNAVLIDGNCIILANGGQQAEVSLLSVPVPNTGLRFAVNAIASAVSMGNAQCFSNYPIYTPQSVLIYAFSTNGTTFNYTITINGYTF